MLVSYPFPKGNNPKVLSSYYMQLKVQYLCVTLSLLHQDQIWIYTSTQYRMVVHKQNHHSDSGKGRMENTVNHWSIGNLLGGNCDNFLPWQWMKSFGQILVLLSGRDFLNPLSFYPPSGRTPCSLSSMAISELGNNK